MSLVDDECVKPKSLFVGYCYDQSHPRLKIKFVEKLRMQNNVENGESYSMEGLLCVFCGGKLWFNKYDSHVAGNRLAYDCPVCKVGLEYLGKLVKDCITYDEIIRVKVGKGRYYN